MLVFQGIFYLTVRNLSILYIYTTNTLHLMLSQGTVEQQCITLSAHHFFSLKMLKKVHSTWNTWCNCKAFCCENWWDSSRHPAASLFYTEKLLELSLNKNGSVYCFICLIGLHKVLHQVILFTHKKAKAFGSSDGSSAKTAGHELPHPHLYWL